MNAPLKRLRLGPLPKVGNVKLTITMTSALRTELDRYAILHSQAYGETIDAASLVPHMLAAFIERDRGFKTLSRKQLSLPANPL